MTAGVVEVALLVLRFPLVAARLGLRNRPPNLAGVDFLPSPSVMSVSDVTSVRFSFLVPRFPKKEERRFSLAGSGVVACAVGVSTRAELSVVSAAGIETGAVVLGSEEPVVMGSSRRGAVADTAVASESLPGIVAESFATGLVVSFLPKRLLNIEFRLLGFWYASRLECPAEDSTPLDSIVSSATMGLVPSPDSPRTRDTDRC